MGKNMEGVQTLEFLGSGSFYGIETMMYIIWENIGDIAALSFLGVLTLMSSCFL